MFKLFKRKPKAAIDEPNPWLKIEPPHNWLPASDGRELVCGECGERKEVKEERHL